MTDAKREPLISVIVPVYNVRKYLDRCVKSVVRQTYDNIEIILVDDGSTDGSGKMCDAWAKNDARVKVVHKENGGLSDARNCGFGEMRGEYVVFVDSDDEVACDYVEYLYYLMKKYDTKMATAPYAVVAGEKKVSSETFETERVLDTEEALKSLLLERGFTVSANAKMYAKDICTMIRYPEGKLCEDNGTTYKFIIESGSIACGNKVVYYYYKNSGSIMGGAFTNKKLDLIELVDGMCDDIDEKYPALKDYTEKKRLNARMSILRQMLAIRLTGEQKKIVQKIKKEVLAKRKIILTNSLYGFRDKAAVIALSMGDGFFAFCWKMYSGVRY